MLGYVDIGVMQFMQGQFPSLTLVWVPPKLTRQALTNAAIKSQQQAPQLPPTATLGIPGIGIFRTTTPRYHEGYTQPVAYRGLPDGLSEDQKTITNLLSSRVNATYTLTAWTQFQSDLNAVERIFSFLDVYKTVSTTIQGIEFSWKINYGTGDPQYDWDVDEKTGKVLWYGITKTIEIPSVWVQSTTVPAVNTIEIYYKELTSGEPINPETLAALENLPSLDAQTIVPSS